MNQPGVEMEVNSEDGRNLEEIILFQKFKAFLAKEKGKEVINQEHNEQSFSVEQSLKINEEALLEEIVKYREGIGREIYTLMKETRYQGVQITTTENEQAKRDTEIEVKDMEVENFEKVSNHNPTNQAIEKDRNVKQGVKEIEQQRKELYGEHTSKNKEVMVTIEEGQERKDQGDDSKLQYFVVFPEESEEERAEDKHREEPEENQKRGMELAIIMESTFSFKRKRQEKEDANQNGQGYNAKGEFDMNREGSKRRKENQNTYKAGVASLIMPHQEP
ncbi:hypothetical protein PIB30_026312 [Stylosanthes scabra]|uniref:Uncharacterized protein n=1 Tax=Stylosanthes scabra TaxID=79078 RepID=A0ABU6W8N1_9FABA|nr:hypothetical protein [Stylosanthes scabra]